MKPYIVFGAGGFAGKQIATTLLEKGQLVQGFSTRDADLTDEKQAAALIPHMSPGSYWVVTSVVRAAHPDEEKSAMIANLRMAVHLADLLKTSRAGHVVFLSSIDVYGRNNLKLPLSETSPLHPHNYYAVSKVSSEQIFDFACRDAGIPLTILRLPGIYGPGDRQWGPVRSFVRAAILHEPLRIQGDGQQRRDLLYVGDLPSIVEGVCRRGLSGVYNAVTGETMCLNEMIAVLERISGQKMERQYDTSREQIDLLFSSPALRRLLPEVEFTPLETGISKLYTYFLERGAHP